MLDQVQGPEPRQRTETYPRGAPFFDITVHPLALQVLDGEVLPILSLHPHDPGLNGVARDEITRQVEPSRLRARIVREGSTLVPHDMVVTAFGKERRDYVDIYPAGIKGELEYCVDCWDRPSIFAGIITHKRDHDGHRLFLRKCLKLVYPDGVPEEIISALKLEIPAKTEKEGKK